MKGPYQIGDKLLVYNNDGQRVFLDSSDINITCHMIEHGQWEPHVRKIMRHILKPGSCYIDVGANIGLHALYAGRLIGPSGKMLLFEPNRNTFNLLKLNMDVNGFRDIADCRMEAVSNLCGKKKFYAIENFSGMSGFMNQFREDKNLRFKKSTVRTVTLDGVAGELNPSLIKIDVEGFERDVILGAKKLLSRSPETTVLLEWTNPPLLGQKAQDDILDFFAGYQCYLAKYMQPLKKMDFLNIDDIKNSAGDLIFTKQPDLEELVGRALEDEELLG